MNHNEIEKIVDNTIEITIGKRTLDFNKISNTGSDNEYVYVPAGFTHKEVPFIGIFSIIISLIIICTEIATAQKGLFSKAKNNISILGIALASSITGILSVICIKNSYREGYYDHVNCWCNSISGPVERSRFYMYIIVTINVLLLISIIVKTKKYRKQKKEELKHE